MKAFHISIEDLFALNKPGFFSSQIKKLVIPKYQREYKWSQDKVEVFITDINNESKFLGNILLDEIIPYNITDTDFPRYEIVDGQQRLTTVILALIAACKIYQESNAVDDIADIIAKIKIDDDFVLENQTVGSFIKEEVTVSNGTLIDLFINDDNDIYKQNDAFNNSFKWICEKLREDTFNLEMFSRKLFSSNFVIIINDNLNASISTEQMFLDINYKSQLLDAEDIFKGYCFKNYSPSRHEELKEDWVEIKKSSIFFYENFGYKGTREGVDVGEYLYLFLLSRPESFDITTKLSYPRGKHFLEDKNRTETKHVVKSLVSYGKNNIDFFTKLADNNYKFTDICTNATRYQNNHNVFNVLKKMCNWHLGLKIKQYYKLPFLMIIEFFKENDSLRNTIQFDELKKIITNLFTYGITFNVDESSNKKAKIDKKITEELFSTNNDATKIANIIRYARELRRDGVRGFILPKQWGGGSEVQKLFFSIYSLMDFYDVRTNFMDKLYLIENQFTKEHLIINDSEKVIWLDTNPHEIDGEIMINGEEEYIPIPIPKYNKNNALNFIILSETINRELGSYDIVSKIHIIEARLTTIPKHVQAIITYIKGMPSYQELERLKNKNFAESQEKEEHFNNIQAKYLQFIEEYFLEEENRISDLRQVLTDAFRSSFSE